MKLKLCSLFSLAIAFAATPLRATTYYWKPGSAGGDYGTLSNWSTESLTGADALVLPGASDALHPDADYAFDLGGGSYEIGDWNKDGTMTTPGRTLSVTNGSLTVTGTWKPSPVTIAVKAGGSLVFGSGSTYYPGQGSGQVCTLSVEDGGSASILHNYNLRNSVLNVASGGTLVFHPASYFGGTSSAAANSAGQAAINNAGTLDLPGGIAWNAGGASGYRAELNQTGGTMNLGGPINGAVSKRSLDYYVSFSGGTVNVTGDTAVLNCKSATLSGDTTWNVAAGKTANLSGVAVSAGTTVAKNGEGTLALPSIPYSLVWNEGAVTFADATVPSAMGTLGLASGKSFTISTPNMTIENLANSGTLEIAAAGLTVTACESVGTITIDNSILITGNTIIETADTNLRNAVIAALGSTSYTTDGNKIVVGDTGAAKEFTGEASTDLSDTANWACGYVPTGSHVTISGAAVATGATLPAFASIGIASTGSLTLSGGADLPSLTLTDGAAVTIAAGASVYMTNGVTGVVSDATKPTITIAEGATLTVDAATAFENITIVANGYLRRVSDTALTYVWAGGSGYPDYATLANWTVDGSTPTRLPCASDSFYNNGNFYFDLGGGTGEIGSWATPGDWDNHYFSVSNGTFVFNGTVSTHSGTWTLADGAKVVFAESSKFIPASGSSAVLNVNIGADSSLEFLGTMQLYNGAFTVANGGRAVFDHASWGADGGSTQPYPAVTVDAGGYAAFPHGLGWTRGGYNSSYKFTLASSGELLLGGDVTMKNPMTLNVAISGGTLDIADDCTILASSSTLSGATTIDVADGVAFRLSNFTVDPEAELTKTGEGTLVLDAETFPASLTVNAGGIGFYTANQSISFPATTAFAENGTGRIVFGANGLTLASAPENASFAIDAEAVTKGAAVVSCSDTALLADIKAALETQLSDKPYEVEVSDGAIYLYAASAYIFKSGATDWSDPGNWTCGYVPTNQDIVVRGNMRISGEFPAFSSIAIERGAAVAVADGIALPPVTVSLSSSLSIEADATVTLTSIDGAATSGQIPVLYVSSGATLNSPGGVNFRNLHLVIDGGTLAFTTREAVSFGYALSGETAYFGMNATNATLKYTTENVNPPDYRFACPAPGGTVVVPEEIVFKDSTLNGWMQGLTLGQNNPTNSEFAVVLDNTSGTWYKGTLGLYGAGTLVVSNGTTLVTSQNSSNNEYFTISDAGQLVVGDGGTVFYPVAGGGNTFFSPGGDVSGRPAVVLAGGVFEPYKMNASAGSTRTLEVVQDSTYQIFEDTYWWDGIRNIVFDGLASATIGSGATLTFCNRYYSNWHGNDNTGVYFATAPIAGEGDIVITNAYDGKAFAMTMRCGENTCTGAISADENSSLVFADGANWAGTVVANGNVALTNGAEAASVTFGALRLESGTFPIRLWHDAENGYTVDHLNITGSGIDCAGGRFELVPQGDYTLPRGTRVYLGRWAKAAVPSGAVRFNGAVMQFLAADVDGEPSRSDVYLRALSGFIIMIR